MVRRKQTYHNRDHLKYPSDLTDEEWSLIEPLMPPAKSGGDKGRTVIDEWFKKVVKAHAYGRVDLFRYADGTPVQA